MHGGIRLPYCPSFLVVRPDGGVHSPLGQFPRFGKTTSIRLSFGCERQSKRVIFGLALYPLLLFRHRTEVPASKGKNIGINVEAEIIQFSDLGLLDNPPGFVEALQGKSVVGETYV